MPETLCGEAEVPCVEHCSPLFAIDTRSHARLNPLLVGVDAELQRWAPYGRSFYGARGLPLTAGSACLPREEWPEVILVTDTAVLALHWALSAAVFAHYFDRGTARPARYALLVEHFVRQRPQKKRARLVHAGTAAFRNNLDRARWSLKFALEARGVD
jgi:hypothetical protein